MAVTRIGGPVLRDPTLDSLRVHAKVLGNPNGSEAISEHLMPSIEDRTRRAIDQVLTLPSDGLTTA